MNIHELLGVCLTLFLIIGFPVFLFVMDGLLNARRLRKALKLTEKDKRYLEAYDQRLLAPQFSELESHFGHAIPNSIINLYLDKELIVQKDFEIVDPSNSERVWDISTFVPADLRTIKKELWRDVKLKGKFIFATNGFGDDYFVALQPHDESSPVFIYYHDGSDIEKVSDSLDVFLSWPRRRQTRESNT